MRLDGFGYRLNLTTGSAHLERLLELLEALRILDATRQLAIAIADLVQALADCDDGSALDNLMDATTRTRCITFDIMWKRPKNFTKNSPAM